MKQSIRRFTKLMVRLGTDRDERKAPPSHMDTLEQRVLMSVIGVLDGGGLLAAAGVVDVADFGALPDDGIDDTAAIQQAIDASVNANRIIYLRDGQYDLSSSLTVGLQAGSSGGANATPRRTIFEGESRDGTILKLQDNLAGFSGAVIEYEGATADAFRNAVRDLTIDIGLGNADATGLIFVGSNQATVDNVLIRSTDPAFAGDVGLQLGTGNNGPLLVRNLEVQGFDIGIQTRFQTASQAFEHITISDQNVYGWANDGNQNVFVRNLMSTNDVTAVFNRPVSDNALQNSVFTIVDSTLNGAGSAPGTFAIRTEDLLYARNVSTTGYDQPVQTSVLSFPAFGNKGLFDGDFIEEFWSLGTTANRNGGGFELFENSPDTSLGLEVRNTPDIPIDLNASNYASPADFGGVAGDGIDDSAAFQAAIDSGATTVYVPNGLWQIEQDVILRGNVSRLVGTEATLQTLTGNGMLRVADGSAPAVVIERLESPVGSESATIQHDTARTLVLNNLRAFNYESTVSTPGDLYLNDVEFRTAVEFRNQDVWARQFNIELRSDVNDPTLPDQYILNDNANLWALGVKVELTGTILRTINGGNSEILGLYRNGSGQTDANNPAIVTVDAATSVVNFDIAPGADGYDVVVSETRNGETRTATSFGAAGLYTGFDDDDLWALRQEVILDNNQAVFAGNWSGRTASPAGFIGDNFQRNQGSSGTATYTPDLPQAGEYEVFARYVDDNGNIATQAAYTVNHEGGATAVNLNQQVGSGRWVSLGTFNFDAGTSGSVVLDRAASNGWVSADGVRFVLADTPIPNQSPVANDDSANTAEDEPVLVSVLTNDTDPDAGDTLSIDGVGAASNGTTEIVGDQVRYTPDAAFTGSDAFTYTVTDSNGGFDTATVTLTVDENSVTPVVLIDESFDTGAGGFVYADDTFRGTERPEFAEGSFQSDAGLTGGGLTTRVGGVNNANVYDGMSGGFTRSFVLDTAGEVTVDFDYRLETNRFGTGEFGQALVSIDGTLFGLNGNDFLAEFSGTNDTGWVSVSFTTTLSAGTHDLTLGGFVNRKTRSVERADVSFDNVLVQTGSSTPVPNQSPIAGDDSASTTGDEPVLISVLANDTDPDAGDTLSIDNVGPASNGVTQIVGDQVRYTPDAAFTGSDSFTYTVTDSNGGFDTATVTVTVNTMPNQSPMAVNDAASTTDDQSVLIGVLTNDTDPDPTDTLSIDSVGAASNGVTEIVGDQIRYTPNTAFIGSDAFTYTVTDGNGGFDTATVDITVTDGSTTPEVLIDESFDTDAGGFVYADDTFRGTNQPDFASGSFQTDAGLTGGGLTTRLGSVNNNNVYDGMSGGFIQSFDLATQTDVTFTFDYRLQTNRLGNNEIGQALVSVNGVLFGANGNDFLMELTGTSDSGWVTFTFTTTLEPGTHELILGGHLSQKTRSVERADVSFDNVLVTTGS